MSAGRIRSFIVKGREAPDVEVFAAATRNDWLGVAWVSFTNRSGETFLAAWDCRYDVPDSVPPSIAAFWREQDDVRARQAALIERVSGATLH